jgi:hypothetical protein
MNLYSGSFSFTARAQRNKMQIIRILGRKGLISYLADN